MMKRLALMIVLAACGGSSTTIRNHAPPPQGKPDPHAQGLAAGMKAQQLTPIQLERVKREMTSAFPQRPRVIGGELVLVETAGWQSEPAMFARRESDGAIVMIAPRPRKIVHEVAAGCRTFAGGRAWFEEVRYRLPPGETFGGIVEVPYEEHVDVPRYSDRQPDGSPCPPPAID
ncbi:MAG TPA: hypothetical protein VFQ53_36310 [Kofleriaceae bacterium]|nr:hypothetical protein [Kofleriaceae bacterium]